MNINTNTCVDCSRHEAARGVSATMVLLARERGVSWLRARGWDLPFAESFLEHLEKMERLEAR